MDDDRTTGWLAARVELGIAVIAVLIIPIWFVTQPDAFLPAFTEVRYEPLAEYIPIPAEIVMVLALAWMIRIWRGPTRDVSPAWRYRDSE